MRDRCPARAPADSASTASDSTGVPLVQPGAKEELKILLQLITVFPPIPPMPDLGTFPHEASKVNLEDCYLLVVRRPGVDRVQQHGLGVRG